MWASWLFAAAAGADEVSTHREPASTEERGSGLRDAVEELLRARPDLVLSVLENHPVLVADLRHRGAHALQGRAHRRQPAALGLPPGDLREVQLDREDGDERARRRQASSRSTLRVA